MNKEIVVPEGYKARIEGNKVIFEQKESDDERIRKAALEGIEYLERKLCWDFIGDTDILDVKEYLEKQKDASKAIESVKRIDKYIDEHVVNAHDMKDSDPDKIYYRGWDDALGNMAGILQDVYSGEKTETPMLTDEEIEDLIAYYGNQKLKVGEAKSFGLSDGTKIVVSHLNG